MANPVVLTLGANSVLTNPTDIITYQIINYCTVPKTYAETYFDMVISLGDTISKFSNSPSRLCSQINTELTGVFSRLFPYGNITVNATTTEPANNGQYSLNIGVIVVINGTSYSISRSLSVLNGVMTSLNDRVNTVVVKSLDLD